MPKLMYVSRTFIEALMVATGRKRRSARRQKRDPFCRPALRQSGFWHRSPAAMRLHFRRVVRRATA